MEEEKTITEERENKMIEATKDVEKEFPPFKPATYYGGNLLIFGLSYLLLRQYKRFFIYFGLTIILRLLSLIYFPNLLPFIMLFLQFGSAYDAYIIAKKLKAKTIPVPEKNPVLATLVIIILAIMVVSTLMTV